MNKIFAIGDLHLSFTSEKPMGIFGPNWDDHHLKIETNWRNTVSADDTVFLLGDLSWGLKFEEAAADLEWIHRLPGRKVLLKGNHDLWWQSVTRLRALYDDMIFIQNDSVACDGVALCGSRGWLTPQEPSFKESEDRKIYERELIRLRLSLEDAKRKGAAHLIAGLHFAPSARPELRSGFMELLEAFDVDQVVYGHLHGRDAFKKGVKDERFGIQYSLVSADYIAFNPLRIV
ncbi:MAG: metallophosphoesterase [Clostridiales Family XIII bacterium]|jgi:predicted phosphohydrolase|nr:metallophosphoesterase [Clostridiales Family XIII bacterium]